MAVAQTYQLKIYDRPLAQFSFEKTLTGFRARGLEVDESAAHLLPLNILQVRSDAELVRFLESRRIPKGRAYLEEVLCPWGLAPADTKGIIDLSRGVSVNDAYSVVPADDDIPYCDYNLFDNDFDEILQVIAYTGVIPAGAVGTGRPSDLTPSGAFPKTWRKVDGQLVLYKAGSALAAPNYGREPYAEQLAWQVARAGGFDAVPYELTCWKGKVCSTCVLFNSSDVAYVPFELCLPLDVLQLCDFEMALAYFEDLGNAAGEAFRSMAVFDSLVANTDRHAGNFGVLRNNRTGEVVGMAPLFDHNVSLFSREPDEELDLGRLTMLSQNAPGIMDATLPRQGRAMLGSVQRAQVERLVDFSFDGTGFIEEYRRSHPDGKTVSAHRLDVLSAYVRERVRELLA